MSLIKYLEICDRIHHFIRRKATGQPKEFAERLSVSERQLFTYLSDLKDMGAPIEYDSFRKTYYYSREVKFEPIFRIMSDSELILSNAGSILKPLYFEESEGMIELQINF